MVFLCAYVVKQLITDNPELATELEVKIRGKIAEAQLA